MPQALNDLESFLHAPKELPPLVELALVHHQFEAIHPFEDGNGRIGRLLIPLLLCEGGQLPQPLLYLSAFFDKHRDAYMDHLLKVSQTGAWLAWVQFFLEGVAQQAKDAVDRSSRLQDLWQDYRNQMQTARGSALTLQLIDQLFATPFITVGLAQRLLNVTYPSALGHINRLVRAEILQERRSGRRPKVYAARAVLDILRPD
jgi:Fic family protein